MANIWEACETVRQFGLTLPESWEDYPWEHRALKVRKKVFVFLPNEASLDTGFNLSLKLKASHEDAMEEDFTTPTGYGMGRHGWVSAAFKPDDEVDVDQLMAWVEESYRLIAPKKCVKELDA
jgi:predicted DNA-binding protein (MmcQ/YjbR family)